MIVNIDERKLSFGKLVFGHHQRGGWIVAFKIHGDIKGIFLCVNGKGQQKQDEQGQRVTDHVQRFVTKYGLTTQ